MKLQAQKTSENKSQGRFQFQLPFCRDGQIWKHLQNNHPQIDLYKYFCWWNRSGTTKQWTSTAWSKDPIHWLSKETDRLKWSQTYSIHNPNIQQETHKQLLAAHIKQHIFFAHATWPPILLSQLSVGNMVETNKSSTSCQHLCQVNVYIYMSWSKKSPQVAKKSPE